MIVGVSWFELPGLNTFSFVRFAIIPVYEVYLGEATDGRDCNVTQVAWKDSLTHVFVFVGSGC
jgi:hypothetical protein